MTELQQIFQDIEEYSKSFVSKIYGYSLDKLLNATGYSRQDLAETVYQTGMSIEDIADIAESKLHYIRNI